mgnify:CR=1 FL=1
MGDGFRQAGYNIKLSAEMDPHCHKTLVARELYYSNKSKYINYLNSGLSLEKYLSSSDYNHLSKNVLKIHLDIKNLKIISEKSTGADVLVGGPPCKHIQLSEDLEIRIEREKILATFFLRYI